MKQTRSYIISIIILLILSNYKFIYSKDVISENDNPDKVTDIENAIIIKGIESEYENGLYNLEGSIIYDDSFNTLQLPKNKKFNPENSADHKKSESLISTLKKQDSRWHVTSHRIKKGENLWSIAKKYDTDYKIIIKANEINKPDCLNPGNTILIPNRTGINHKVNKNETLTGISKKYRIQKNKIISHNNIKKDIIKEGKYLFIPDAVVQEIKIVKTDAKKINKNREFNPEDDEPEDIPADRMADNFKPKFIWPIKGEITSAFGKRVNPINNKSRFHCGLDIGADIGTPVTASADGESIFSGWKKGYGRVVVLKHADGYITIYAHNKMNILNTGDKIKQGEILALSGISGAVTGPHLHFEIRKYLTPLNPLRFIK